MFLAGGYTLDLQPNLSGSMPTKMQPLILPQDPSYR
jgi:hypothetical protein